MNIESRIARIARIGSWLSPFFAVDMIQSGMKLIDIQIALSNFVNHTTLYKLNVELVEIIEYEFRHKRKSYKGFDSHRGACFDLMYPKTRTLLGSNITLFQNWIANYEVLKIFERRINAQKIWSKIINILIRSGKLTDEEKIIELNLLYLSIFEGFFEQDVKICYCFLEMSNGNSIDMEIVNKMDISNMIKKFKQYGENSILFEGYNNKLRNSIAHFSFEYDQDKKKMVYEDNYQFKKDGKTKPWKAEYSQNNIFWFNQKIINVSELVTVLLGILFIRDACFAGDTWK